MHTQSHLRCSGGCSYSRPLSRQQEPREIIAWTNQMVCDETSEEFRHWQSKAKQNQREAALTRHCFFLCGSRRINAKAARDCNNPASRLLTTRTIEIEPLGEIMKIRPHLGVFQRPLSAMIQHPKACLTNGKRVSCKLGHVSCSLVVCTECPRHSNQARECAPPLRKKIRSRGLFSFLFFFAMLGVHSLSLECGTSTGVLANLSRKLANFARELTKLKQKLAEFKKFSCF